MNIFIKLLRNGVAPPLDSVYTLSSCDKFFRPGQRLASEPRPSPFLWSVIERARAECNCVWANLREKRGRPGLKHHVRVG